MHACELAQELRIPRVLVPLYPGILSALGVATADVVKDYSHTVMLKGDALTVNATDGAFQPLEVHAVEELAREGFGSDRLTLHRLLDVRYVGQSYELAVPCPPAGEPDFRDAVSTVFHQAHQQRFGYGDVTQQVEIINVRLKAVGSVDRPVIAQAAEAQTGKVSPIAHTATVFDRGAYPQTPIYRRESLSHGSRVAGPAIVVQMDATTVLPPGWGATVDGWGNLVAEQG